MAERQAHSGSTGPRIGLAVLLGASLGLVAAQGAGASMGACQRAAEIAARELDVPVRLLEAIMIVETGWNGPQGFGPWSWTTNEAGQGRRFATRKQAEDHVLTALAKGGRNIDLGCFQLNHRWHGGAFASVDQMLDPVANARHAARFLKALWRETGDWLLAAGAYHSRTPDLAASYRQKVAAAMGTSSQADGPAPAASPGPTGLPLLRAAAMALVDPHAARPPLFGRARRQAFGPRHEAAP